MLWPRAAGMGCAVGAARTRSSRTATPRTSRPPGGCRVPFPWAHCSARRWLRLDPWNAVPSMGMSVTSDPPELPRNDRPRVVLGCSNRVAPRMNATSAERRVEIGRRSTLLNQQRRRRGIVLFLALLLGPPGCFGTVHSLCTTIDPIEYGDGWVVFQYRFDSPLFRTRIGRSIWRAVGGCRGRGMRWRRPTPSVPSGSNGSARTMCASRLGRRATTWN